MTQMHKYILGTALIALFSASAATAQMGTAFTYQGLVKDRGELVTDTGDFTFEVWDAASGGQWLGKDMLFNVPIADGLFTTVVDLGPDVFNGDPRWLEITVNLHNGGNATLTPRQPFTPTPYALYALNSGGGGSDCLWSENGSDIYYNTGDVGVGTTAPTYPLHVTSSQDTSIYARTTSTTGAAVYAEATSATGTVNGIFADTASPEGSGVFGQNTAASGQNEGVMGVSWSSFGKGVMGYNGSTSSTAIGVLGRTSGGAGVQGEATSTTAYNKGVHGLTSSPNGYGVYGYAPTDGKGVAGYSGSYDYGYLGWDGGGVYGYSIDGFGVRGYSANDWGIFGSVPNGSTQTGIVGAITLDNGGTLWKSNSGVSGGCQDGQGVAGRTIEGIGVFGEQTNSGNYGHLGTSTEGVYGETSNSNSYGVHGKATGSYSTTNGVYGEATGAGYGIGVRGSTEGTNAIGVYGYNGSSGYGGSFYSSTGTAGRFVNNNGDCVVIDHNAGVYSNAALNIDVSGSEEPVAIEAVVDATYGRLADFELNNATSYIGTSFKVRSDCGGDVASFINDNTTTSDSSDYAVYAEHLGAGSGVWAKGAARGVSALAYPDGSSTYYGLYAYVSGGTGTNRAVYGRAVNGATNYAGYFSGDVYVTGMMSKGGGSFKIDHPLDPENKYLYHSFVESPDMMNIYNGNAVLDADGEAVVTMPEWFDALNRDFRYQLTAIGAPGPNLYIAEEIKDNQFKIAGGEPGTKVSWQVTGVRQDPFAEANRVQVEVDKPEDERGTYLHPEAFGLSPDLQVDAVREAAEAARTQSADD